MLHSDCQIRCGLCKTPAGPKLSIATVPSRKVLATVDYAVWMCQTVQIRRDTRGVFLGNVNSSAIIL